MKEEDIRKRDVFNKYLELSAHDVDVFFKDRSRFISSNCPACSSNTTENAIVKNKFEYSQCLNCDTLFVNPRPSPQQLHKFYEDSPSTTFWVNEFFLPVKEARREKIFKPRADYFNNYFSERNDNLVVGDIGAGFGLFLEELQKLDSNYELWAIEPSIEMTRICQRKGLSTISEPIEHLDEAQYSFDILTAFELFEHLFSPKDFLVKVYNLLKPGGYFLFTTLNGLGFDIQILWDKSKSISPPHHLNFFNPHSAKILLDKVGFKVEEVSTPGVLDWDIVEGAHLKESSDIGRLWKTVSKYGNTESKKDLQKWITEHNFSSHMRFIVKKI